MAGEPETLDLDDEPLARRLARHHYDRLLMLSDGVFAIAITLLALELRPPEHWSGGLWELLVEGWRALFGYVFGFLIVGAFWFSHRNLFARLRRIDAPATALSLLLLLLVAMAPAVAALVAKYGPAKALRAYLLLIATTGAVQALLWAYAAFLGRLVDDTTDRRERSLVLVRYLIAPVLLGVSGVLQEVGKSPVSAGVLMVLVIGAVVARRVIGARRRSEG